ncbi:MAG: VOC family protein [Capsulimonadales bacterium]|nr:VOC family protein [Capsulimonadales bacterium]
MPETSTNVRLSTGGYHHIALRARDFDRSFAFYTDGLGFVLAHQWGEGEGRIALLDMGDGNYLELFASKPGQTPPEGGEVPPAWPYFHLAMRSSDVDADIETVRALGCPITIEPKTVEVGTKTIRVGFFLGPDGEVLEFFQHIARPDEKPL